MLLPSISRNIESRKLISKTPENALHAIVRGTKINFGLAARVLLVVDRLGVFVNHEILFRDVI